MESAEILDGNDVPEAAVCYAANKPLDVNVGNGQGSEKVGDHILQDLDSYLSEIDDRLTISRMVSDSVVKVIVSAVLQEAVEIVSAKESRVAELEEALRRRHLGYDKLNMLVTSLHEWQVGHELQKQIELLVIRDAIQRLQEGREGRLRDENVDICGNDIVGWKEQFKGMLSLRQVLDAIQKALSSLEVGHLSSQASLEMDHTHHKALSNHVLAHDELEEFKINMPENLESSQLKHMKSSELYTYFRTKITTMKRDHESERQQMAEEIISLKGQLLKERKLLKEQGFFPPSKRDKDFDMLKNKVTEAILKLDCILLENENLPKTCDISMNRRDSILCENRPLKELLACKDNEIKYLSSKVSEDAEKLSQRSLVEENLYGEVENLKHFAEDAQLEASISEDVCQFHSDEEEADVRSAMLQEILGIIYDGVAHQAKATMKQESRDLSDIESLIMQGISGVVLQEVLKGLETKLKDLKIKCLQDEERFVLLESKSLRMEKELWMADEGKKMLKHEIVALERLAGENGNSIVEVTTALEKEREQFESANEEVAKLMSCRKQLGALIFQRNEELKKLKIQIEESLQQIDLLELKTNELNQKLDQEKQNILSSVEAKDKDYGRLMESHIRELLKELDNFESGVAERIKWQSSRLDNATFQVSSLIQRFEKRRSDLQKAEVCSDLQKAEAEVDLLGDQVDALLDLLEEIYIALDHYAPILEHYPGIMDILKLVKRELSGESTRAVFQTP